MKKLALVNLLLATAIGLSACGKYNDDIQQYAQKMMIFSSMLRMH